MRVLLEHERAVVFVGDSGQLDLPEASVDSLVTDPPSAMGFMAKDWDSDRGGRDRWCAWLAETLIPSYKALKPGGHGLVWAIPRTSHWTAVALEDVGFEVRDVHHHVHACVPLETEMLTERGWVRPEDLEVGEPVVHVDARGRASFTRLEKKTVYSYRGEMYRVSTASTEQLLTPGHTVHAYAKRSKWRGSVIDDTMTALPANSFCGEDHTGVAGWRLPLAAREAQSRKRFSTIEIARLYGWIIAEGGFHRDVRAVSIWQNEGDNANEIRRLLKVLRIPHSEYKRTRTDYDGTPRKHVQWYLRVGKWTERILKDLAGDKPTPPEWLAWLPEDQALALFEALVDGDGSRNGDNSGAWYQKRPGVRAWFQTLCFRLGYRSRENATKSMVSWCRRGTTDVGRGSARYRWATTENFNGHVWCPTVANGRWVARYRGCVFVTGNTGFPKSLDLCRQVDMHLCTLPGRHYDKNLPPPSRRREGDHLCPEHPERERVSGVRRTALKPAVEHWVLVRKPLEGSYVENALKYGTGGLNVEACRIGDVDTRGRSSASFLGQMNDDSFQPNPDTVAGSESGRWPANLSLDAAAQIALEEQRAGASQFYFCAKPSSAERDEGLDHLPTRSGGEMTGRQDGSAGVANPRAGAGRGGDRRNTHVTVKSVALMRWLCRLVTPPGGVVLDPFAGSGSTGVAALAEGMSFIGCELGGDDGEYIPVLDGRIRHALGLTL